MCDKKLHIGEKYGQTKTFDDFGAEQVWGEGTFARWGVHKQIGFVFSKLFRPDEDKDFVGTVDKGFVRQRFVKSAWAKPNDDFAPTQNT